jgi:hypothetical protein
MKLRAFAVVLLACVALASSAQAFAQSSQIDVDDAAAATGVDRQLLLMLRVPPPHFRPEAGYGGGYRDAPGRDARRRVA